MRAAPLLSLLIPAVLGGALGLSLVSCHKERLLAAAPSSTAARRLKLESYDAPVPKAPLRADKLETLAPHPQPAPAAVPPPVAAIAPPVQPPQSASRPPPRPRPAPGPRVYAYADPGAGRYIESRQAGDYAPDDPRGDAAPEPPGFRLTVKLCREAARQGDPLAETQECQGMLQAARAQAELCARAYAEGDDRVVLSAACRQAAMAR